MPTKILVWNIQNFTINKIDFEKGERIALPSPPSVFFATSSTILKNDYIIDNVALANPDIFIVIEVVSGRGPKGSMVTSKGAMGVQTLLKRLKSLSNNWFLVPPLKLTDQIQVAEIDDEGPDEDLSELISEGGYTEAIAVFFRKDKVDFVGPNVWPTVPGNDNPGKASVPPGPGVVAGAYPAEWQSCLPRNDDGSYNYFAGRADFRTAGGDEWLFPAIQSRRPFLTKFRERQGMRRFLTIASVHFPPQPAPAKQAFVALVEYFNTDYAIAQDEIILIAGDYNINYYQDTERVFEFLRGQHFFTVFNGTAQPTMYKRNGSATPTDYRPQKGLDNASVKYGSQAIFQGLTGMIFDRVRNDPGTVPPITSLLYTPYNDIISQPTPDEQNDLFREPFNFGKFGPAPGTSDHLAIYVEL